MAYAGQRISNPVTGENFTFIKTSRDTDGEALVFDCRVEPGKATLPPHVHDTQEERFKIKSGRLGVMLGSKQHVLDAVGPRLRELRHRRGLTLADLAERTGISESTLSRLENVNHQAGKQASAQPQKVLGVLEHIPKRPAWEKLKEES